MNLYIVSVPRARGAFLVLASTDVAAVDHVRYCKEWTTLEQFELVDKLRAVPLGLRTNERDERIVALIKGGDVELC